MLAVDPVEQRCINILTHSTGHPENMTYCCGPKGENSQLKYISESLTGFSKIK